ncbi:MAG: CapA family protein [Planctomycetes bacterium]|nr:CapA family protein [Planctomycetota bacterium]
MAAARLHIPLAPRGGDGSRWTLCAVGDVCVPVEDVQAVPQQPLAERFAEDLTTLIRGAELSIVNLEAPTCHAGIPIPKSGPPLRMHTAVPAELRSIGFDVATLANNHVMDFGPEGLDETLTACQQAGLSTCGAGANGAAAAQPVRAQPADGVRVSVLAFCEREFGIAANGSAGTAWLSDPTTLNAVAEACSAADVVVVVAHGGVEAVPLPPPQRCEQMRRLVDAGATLVIGHHPHVPHGWEQHGGGFVLYSLGNCLFDYAGGERLPKTDWGLAVTATFEGATLAGVEIALTEQRDGIVGIMQQTGEHWDYLKRLCAVTADRDRHTACWQELALQLLATRYRPYLVDAVAGPRPPVGVRPEAKRLLHSLGRRIGLLPPLAADERPGNLRDPLLLLNLLRNESHRWAITAALEVLSGAAADWRTPETEAEVRELLRWTLD